MSDEQAASSPAFEIEGTVSFVNAKHRFVVVDATGAMAITPQDHLPCVKTGDVVRVGGTVGLTSWMEHDAFGTNIQHIGVGHIPATREATEQLVREGRLNYQLVHVRGAVYDAFKDEIDQSYNIFVLRDNTDTFVVALADSNLRNEDLARFIGAQVNVSGICLPLPGDRQFMSPHIAVADLSSISVEIPPLADIHVIPLLEAHGPANADISSRTGRRRITGSVVATWQTSEMLVKTDDGRRLHASLARGLEPPPASTQIDAVGFPETDNFRINLKGCIFKPCGRSSMTNETARTVNGRTLMTGPTGSREINYQFSDQLVKITGTVVSIPSPNDSDCRIGLQSDGYTIPIDCSSIPDVLAGVTIGCRLEITGFCILKPEHWSRNAPFQHINGLFLVPRTETDIRIVSRPPWLTVRRLLVVVGSLLALIVGFIIRNRILNRLVERRSRELMREEIAHAKADLKVEERTRLAVELHDTLAQNITGVALQIDAAQTAAEKDPASVLPYLETTRRKMQNCRDNLRNCLWDLRSRAFEEERLDDAIRKTIAHHLGGTQAEIHCGIRCRGLSDNTVHAVLCIVRELTINAVRHGMASRIVITGEEANGRLSFSVHDDGCGFDPMTRPGMSEGHFGLQGVDERIRRLGGTWHVDSRPGNGCTVVIENLNADN